MTSLSNTNLNSLTAQRAVDRTADGLSTTIQRLSSGLRINGAADDAAGLAISDRFSSQIRGLNQAARNANDGISMAQTAEGALGTISSNLQRMRELAVQSANDTNSAADRTALQAEYGQLSSEIDRIAASTQFNGQNLLDGSFSTQRFQVGANREQSITVGSIANASTSAQGQWIGIKRSVFSLPVLASISAPGQVLINGVDLYQGQAITTAGKDIAAAINALNIAGISATAGPTTTLGQFFSSSPGVTAGTGTLSLNGTSFKITISGAWPADKSAVIAAINAQSAATGVVAAAVSGFGGVGLTAADGRGIAATWAPGTATNSGLDDLGLGDLNLGNTYFRYTLVSTGTNPLVIGGTVPSSAGLFTGTTTAIPNGVALSQTNIATGSGANTALDSLDSALNSINASRAQLGALQNRFASTITNVQSSSDNMSASRSRIVDADFAQETANLSRSQILQQAGIAMVAQANQLPQSVLALLQSGGEP